MQERVQILGLIVGVALMMFGVASPSFGASVDLFVPGTSNPYLAGMPNGAGCCITDSAPGQSPKEVPGGVSGGQVLTFSGVSGTVANGPACAPNDRECSTNGPDGGAFFVSQQSHQPGTDSSNGIARMNAPLNALVGVFLDNNQPDSSGPPGELDFAQIGTSFGSLSPGLKQPFFIGDGFTGTGSGDQQTFVVPNGATRLFLGTVDGTGWANNQGGFSLTVNGVTGSTPPPPAGPLAAAVLPASRAVQVGGTATVFATIINAGSGTATDCGIAPAIQLPGGFMFQTTNPANNSLTNSPNQRVSIGPGGNQSFLIALTPNNVFGPSDVPFTFSCANAGQAAVIGGLNTLQFLASGGPTADVVMVAATSPNDGIFRINGGNGAFAVAMSNVGATDTVTITADTGSRAQPLSILLCQTDPGSGACISAMAPSVSFVLNSGANATVGVFVNASAGIGLDPAGNRIFVRATAGGQPVGATSVADVTQ
jgi:hypothetical protein